MAAATKQFNDQRAPFARFKVGHAGMATVLATTPLGRTLVEFVPAAAADSKGTPGKGGRTAALAKIAVGSLVDAKVVWRMGGVWVSSFSSLI